MDKKLVIWGASGHALVVADIIRLGGGFEIVGFLDDLNPERHNTKFCGAFILGGKEQLDILQRSGVRHLIFGFGDCEARLRLSAIVRSKGFSQPIAIHPQAIIAPGVSIGPGTTIGPGAVVNPGSSIHDNAIINTCASVDHECIIEEGVHIGPGVHLGGKVKISRGTWIGIGATIIDRVNIGARSIIGAGSVVINDITEGVVAYGNPAKVIKEVPLNDC